MGRNDAAAMSMGQAAIWPERAKPPELRQQSTSTCRHVLLLQRRGTLLCANAMSTFLDNFYSLINMHFTDTAHYYFTNRERFRALQFLIIFIKTIAE
jgi:hypothetical protein